MSDPIRASIQVRPITTQARSIERPYAFSFPTEAIICSLGLLLALGSSVNVARAQTFKTVKETARKVTVLRLEVNREEIKKDFKLVLYVNGITIEPERVDGSFFVPAEVRKSKTVTVRFLFDGYDLLFDSVYPSKFDADWIIGVDTKPFDSAYVNKQEARHLKLLYYLEFVPKEGEGTELVVKVSKTPTKTFKRFSVATIFRPWRLFR